MSNSSSPSRFTDKQGQYLAFIHTCVLLHGRSPAEADMETYFGVTPPSVHRMVLELERRGLLRRVPRQARTIEVVVAAADLPPPAPPIDQNLCGRVLAPSRHKHTDYDAAANGPDRVPLLRSAASVRWAWVSLVAPMAPGERVRREPESQATIRITRTRQPNAMALHCGLSYTLLPPLAASVTALPTQRPRPSPP